MKVLGNYLSESTYTIHHYHNLLEVPIQEEGETDREIAVGLHCIINNWIGVVSFCLCKLYWKLEPAKSKQ